VFLSRIRTSLLLIRLILFYVCDSFLIFTTLNSFKSINVYKLFRRKHSLSKLILLLTRNLNTSYISKKFSRSLSQQQYCLDSYFCLFLNFAFVVFSFYYYLRNSILVVAILNALVAIERYSKSL